MKIWYISTRVDVLYWNKSRNSYWTWWNCRAWMNEKTCQLQMICCDRTRSIEEYWIVMTICIERCDATESVDTSKIITNGHHLYFIFVVCCFGCSLMERNDANRLEVGIVVELGSNWWFCGFRAHFVILCCWNRTWLVWKLWDKCLTNYSLIDVSKQA